MAVLEIKKFNNPVLRKKCEEVKEINGEIKKLIADIIETMEKNHGLGLAAPQIGILKRIIVARSDLAGFDISCLINPKIIKKSSKTEIGEEGCLSFPGLYLKIRRAKEVEVRGLDISGKEIKISASGLLARVLQHEIDHLNGILFFGRLGFFQKWKFWKKLKKLI